MEESTMGSREISIVLENWSPKKHYCVHHYRDTLRCPIRNGKEKEDK